MSNVVWIPGVLGSSIGVKLFGSLTRPEWVDVPTILAGDIAALQLAPDGQSPGPLARGQQTVVTDIFRLAYGPASALFRLAGHQVLDLGWDWRKELIGEAAVRWPTIAAWAQGSPVVLVAHSLGGLLARALWATAVAAGQGGLVRTIITVGAPHFGSWEAARVWYGLPFLYRGLQLLAGAGAQYIQRAGPNWLAAIVATWPGWYEMMPWRDSGPLAAYSPAQAAFLYSPLGYDQSSPMPSAAWLGAAPALQAQLAGMLPPFAWWSIAGVGFATPWAFDGTRFGAGTAGLGYDERDYQLTQQGDSYVTVAEASAPGATVLTVPVEHTFQPLDPRSLGRILGILDHL